MITVNFVQQPTAHTCVHSCLSMVTGVPVNDYIKRFGEAGLSFKETAIALTEAKIFPVLSPVPWSSNGYPFPKRNCYHPVI